MTNHAVNPSEILTPAQEILNHLKQGQSVTLTGDPGSGKTFNIKAVTKLLEEAKLPYALAAPTHKAAQIIAYETSLPTVTVAKLQKKFLVVDEDKGERFLVRSKHARPIEFICIIDEASMLNKDAVRTILEDGTTCLFVGDPHQLPPVKEGSVSSIYKLGIPNIHLEGRNKRYGESKGILAVTEYVRNCIKTDEPIHKSKLKALCAMHPDTQWVSGFSKIGYYAFKRDIQSLENNSTFLESDMTSLLSYKNATVHSNNAKLSKAFFGSDEIQAGHWCCINRTISDQISDTIVTERGNEFEEIMNIIKYISGTIVRVIDEVIPMDLPNKSGKAMDVKIKRITIQEKEIYPDTFGYDYLYYYQSIGFRLTRPQYNKLLNNIVDDELPAPQPYKLPPTELIIPKNPEMWEKLLKTSATYISKSKKRFLWPSYYKCIEFLKDIRPIFSRTVHNSQGSTYKRVLLDISDIEGPVITSKLDKQLIYVGVSRPTTELLIKGSCL